MSRLEPQTRTCNGGCPHHKQYSRQLNQQLLLIQICHYDGGVQDAPEGNNCTHNLLADHISSSEFEPAAQRRMLTKSQVEFLEQSLIALSQP